MLRSNVACTCPYTTAVSEGLSDGIDTPELASDGGSESTSSLDASPPTPNSSREAISEDTPTARHIVDSIKVNATGERHRGPSEISEEYGRGGNEHPLYIYVTGCCILCKAVERS